ncbi:Ldh family oxidoreductase [Vibrio sp. SCSIO 43140]|uniref:Ldh family oxidoreductase n=1 Tax=Vibrio sp. SCSIO 43140 TaxID=2819100 RepID=UPI0020761B60|nr:Ldh family oxidoreductase [Vibrio sp. SCSIO 43140]USD60074.1 Ldh family oxidoreductase [Vibrio sp. SCSIO 43140]
MSASPTLTFDNEYYQFVVSQAWLHVGADKEHADIIARNTMNGGLQGKLHQGLGVMEAVTIPFEAGVMDVSSKPVVESEGETWAVFDGQRSSGHYTLTLMAESAIEKARKHGISIVFGYNHVDGGNFSNYAQLAAKQGMFAMTSNNSIPLNAPFGGMDPAMSCPPFDAACVGGEELPLVTSIMLGEGYDANISDALINNKRLNVAALVDQETGELTDDAAKWGRLIPGYGRVADCDAPWTFLTPRLYSLNIWNEVLSAIINPKAKIAPELPALPSDCLKEGAPTPVGGSYIIVIDPSHFGPLDEVKRKSDEFVRAIKANRPRKGFDEVFIPDEWGLAAMRENATEHQVLTAHWNAFKDFLVRQGTSIEALNQKWKETVGEARAEQTVHQ